MSRVRIAIGQLPRPGDWAATIQLLQSLKHAVESMLGQGKSAMPKEEKAITGADLVKLGIISEADLRKL